MEDGLYQVTTPYLCAGFVVENGQVTECAPILRKKLAYWQTVAKKVEVKEMPEVKGIPDAFVIVDFSNFVHTCWWPAISAQRADPKYDAKEVLKTNMYGKLGTIGKAMADCGYHDVTYIFVEDQIPTEKLKLYPEYKAGRNRENPPPKEEAKAWLVEHGYTYWCSAPDSEADDTIATLVTLLSGDPDSIPIVIVSSDKDLWQLIQPGVLVYRTTTGKFVTDAMIQEEFGVLFPDQIPLCKAMWGDASDNIPNVMPRMQKQLLPLIKTTDGSLSEFWANFHMDLGVHLTDKCRKMLEENKADIERNYKLVKLKKELNLEFYGKRNKNE